MFKLGDLIAVLLLFFCVHTSYGQSTQVFPTDAWGVYSWTQFTSIDKSTAPLVKGGPIIMRWANLEPQNGVYAFDTELKDKLKTMTSHMVHLNQRMNNNLLDVRYY